MQSQSQFEHIQQFLEVVYTRRNLCLVVAASVALLFVTASCFVPKRYEAKSTVFIENNVINKLMKDLTVSPSLDDSLRVLKYDVLSREMVTLTLKQMQMDVDPRYVMPGKFEELVRKCQSETIINTSTSAGIFTVSLIDTDPDFAKNYINTLIDLYVKENVSQKREESFGANRFIGEQVAFYKQKLDEIDAKILDFRRKTGIYSTINEASLMEQIAKDNEALSEVKRQKAETYATIQTIKQQLNILRNRSSSGNNPLNVNDAASKIAALQAKVDELLQVYNDQYPTVVKLREQIAELQNKEWPPPISAKTVEENDYNPMDDPSSVDVNPIYVDLKMRMNTAQSTFNAMAAKEKDLINSVRESQALLRNFPQDKRILNNLEGERNMQLAIYEKLLQRVGVADVSQQVGEADQASSFRIIDPVVKPHLVSTTRLKLMLLGVLGGLVAGLGVVLIAENIDGSIKKTQTLRNLGVTILGEIPFILTDSEIRLVRKKDYIAMTYAVLCTLIIGIMLLHDLLGMTFIDHIVAGLKAV